jgi:predicted aspartyl protease
MAMTRAGLVIPRPILTTALVDTGASATCLDPSIIEQLHIPPSGSTAILTPSTGSTPHIALQYDVGIGVLLDNGTIHQVESVGVIEASLAHEGHFGLIGRDILSQGLLIYNGPAGTLTLSF